MKPIIGINVDITQRSPQEACVEAHYFKAVEQAGGIPVLLPPMSDDDLSELLPKLNGVMLIGGRDYDPKHYQEQANEKVKLLSPMRDDFDLRLIHKVIVGSNAAVLGICAGAQALNIGLGGSLIQDIPSALPGSHVQHSSPNGWESGWNKHVVHFEPKSKLATIYTIDSFAVPTSHHQAIKRLGSGLAATAHADDGVVEAVEYTDKPFAIGVQWHPERDYDGNRRLFDAFVSAAAKTPVSAK
jgi:putative glutamine amidotransferase